MRPCCNPTLSPPAMARLDDLPQDPLWAPLSSTLSRAGFEPRDFELRSGPRSELGHLITLRRRSTGQRRHYTVMPGSPWLFNAFADLTGGCFGQPAPH